MKVTLTNSFHNSESTLVLKALQQGEYSISRRVQKRVRGELCGIEGCICGDTFGARGGTYLEVVGGFESGDWIVRIS
jgi:hypothetical protein